MGLYNWSPVHCRFQVRHRCLDTRELRCTFGQNGAFVVGYHHHGSLLPPRFSLIRPNISTNKRALREHAVLLQTHSFSCPVVEFCLFTCSTNVCTMGFYIFIRLLFFMHLDYHPLGLLALSISGSAFGITFTSFNRLKSLPYNVCCFFNMNFGTFLDLINPEV